MRTDFLHASVRHAACNWHEVLTCFGEIDRSEFAHDNAVVNTEARCAATRRCVSRDLVSAQSNLRS
jgi:hypothetical protein